MSISTYEALVNYTESQNLSFSSPRMRKLLSTFRVHLAPGFGLMLGYKEEEIANSLGSLPLKKFVDRKSVV